MKQESIKRLLAAGVFGCFIAASAGAQTAPNAEVNAQGQLVINPGTAEEIVIDPPSGEVNAEGNLVIDGTEIMRPDASVNAEGDLVLGDGTVLQVPDLPVDGPEIIVWFGADLFKYDAEAPYDQNQWYFSFTYKNLYHFAANKWFYFEIFDASFFLANDSASGTRENGYWAYTRNLFPDQAEGSWVFISGVNGFQDLREKYGVPDEEAGLQDVNGFLYIMNPSGYPDAEGEGFFYFGEFEDGNYITRFGVDNWVQLR